MPAATRLRTVWRVVSKEPGTPRTHSWVAASVPSILTDTKRSGDFAISEVHMTLLSVRRFQDTVYFAGQFVACERFGDEGGILLLNTALCDDVSRVAGHE